MLRFYETIISNFVAGMRFLHEHTPNTKRETARERERERWRKKVEVLGGREGK